MAIEQKMSQAISDMALNRKKRVIPVMSNDAVMIISSI
jgi:hypothetical protein